MTGRKLTFHLTPLLDLLLIVIFAQFLEVRDTTAAQEHASTQEITRAAEDFEQAQSELEDAQDELDQLRSDRDNTEAALAKLEEELTLLGNVATELSGSRADLEEQLTTAREQRDQVAGLMADVFDLPDDIVQRFLQSDPGRQILPSEEQQEMLKDRVREYSKQKPQAAIRHLLAFEELRKRCDIWELHIGPTGEITFTAGDIVQKFRAETPQQFEDLAFECYKRLPQPKTLVLLMLSYDGELRAELYFAALRGLPRVADRMRQDQNERARFEYTVILPPKSTAPFE